MRVFDNHCVVCGKERLVIADVPHCSDCTPTSEQRAAHEKWVARYLCPFPSIEREPEWGWKDSERISTSTLEYNEHGTRMQLAIYWASKRWRAHLEFASSLEASMTGNFAELDSPKIICEHAAYDLWAILIDRQLYLEE